MNEKHEAFFFLVGSCQTQSEVDDLWLQCYGYPNPETRNATSAG